MFRVRRGGQKTFCGEKQFGVQSRAVEAVTRKHFQLLQIFDSQAELRGNHAHRLHQCFEVPAKGFGGDNRSIRHRASQRLSQARVAVVLQQARRLEA